MLSIALSHGSKKCKLVEKWSRSVVPVSYMCDEVWSPVVDIMPSLAAPEWRAANSNSMRYHSQVIYCTASIWYLQMMAGQRK